MDEISTIAGEEGASPPMPSGVAIPALADEPAFLVEPAIMARVSYALAHNRVPTVPRVRIRNLSSTAGSQLTIAVSSNWAAAETSPMAAQQFVVECPERGDWVELDTTSLRLDDTAIVDLDEAAPASVTVTVSDAAGRCATISEDIVVLARNQWNRDVPDITAAFVQPNHPAVVDVLKDASKILLARTGDGSLQGYQAGPQRAIDIAKAIFEALKTRIPTYIQPPQASMTKARSCVPLIRSSRRVRAPASISLARTHRALSRPGSIRSLLSCMATPSHCSSPVIRETVAGFPKLS